MTSSDNYDDLNELIDDDDLITDGADAQLFHQATTYVQSAAGRLDNAVLLKLYAHYKQATEGACPPDGRRPGWFDFRAKAKYEAWHALGNMARSDARATYVDIVRALGDNGCGVMGGGKDGVGWVTHSTLQGNNDDGGDDEGDGEKDTHTHTLIDFISAHDLSAVTHHLTLHPHLLHHACAPHLLTPHHYAADRGAAHVLRHLLDTPRIDGARAVDARDAHGQTPLHYASACGHADCCRVLLAFGARVGATDHEGHTCLDLATDGAVRELLGDVVKGGDEGGE